MDKKYRTLLCVYSDIFLWLSYVIIVLGLFYKKRFFIALLGISFFLYLLIKVVFGIKNIIIAIKLALANDSDTLFTLMKKTKYGSIWVFVVNYVINFIVVFFTILAMWHAAGLAAPLFWLIGYMTYTDVIFTSCFGITFIILKRKNKEVSKSFVVVNILLSLCFVLDIFDTFYLHYKFKETKETNEV